MHLSIVSLFSIAGLFASSALASPIAGQFGAEKNNAERLARGLPPLPPPGLRPSRSKRMMNPYNADRTELAPRAGPSSATGIGGNGLIAINDAETGSFYGYVSIDSAGAGIMTPSYDASGGLIVSLAPSTTTGLYNMIPTNSPLDVSLSNGGLTGGFLGHDLAVGEGSEYVWFTLTGTSDPLALPADIGSSYGDHGSEAAVWVFNKFTNAITAQWINADGSSPPTNAFLYSAEAYGMNYLGFTSDIPAFNALFPTTRPITLTFQPINTGGSRS